MFSKSPCGCNSWTPGSLSDLLHNTGHAISPSGPCMETNQLGGSKGALGAVQTPYSSSSHPQGTAKGAAISFSEVGSCSIRTRVALWVWAVLKPATQRRKHLDHFTNMSNYPASSTICFKPPRHTEQTKKYLQSSRDACILKRISCFVVQSSTEQQRS